MSIKTPYEDYVSLKNDTGSQDEPSIVDVLASNKTVVSNVSYSVIKLRISYSSFHQRNMPKNLINISSFPGCLATIVSVIELFSTLTFFSLL